MSDSEIRNEVAHGRPAFTLSPYLSKYGRLGAALAFMADRALGFAELTRRYHQIAPASDPNEFAALALDELGVSVHAEAHKLNRIPEHGGCLIVVNHPHGGLDGLALVDLMMRRREDVRLMANHFLTNFVELRELFVQIDPFGGEGAKRFNFSGVREALGWAKNGGALVMFPGGEVSSMRPRTKTIVDPDWDPGVAWLAKRSGVPVIPIHLDGRNSNLFQLGGLVHPSIRTALLVREMLRKKGARIHAEIGKPIEPEVLQLFEDKRALAAYLQTKTYLLPKSAGRSRFAIGRVPTNSRPLTAMHRSIPCEHIEQEIGELDASQKLLSSGERDVYIASADQIPWTLQEIGRLREIAFRAVGEGTGKSADLDLFDSYYRHLFVWDKETREITGGYRLGHGDEILRKFGLSGLYVQSLFKLDKQLADDLYQSLEVGRSFVSPRYQRSHSSLMLLWRGIATYVAKNPRYKILFGPVSISDDYHPLSQQLIVQFLRHQKMEPQRTSLVKPRRPFRVKQGNLSLADLNVEDLRIISDLLNVLEDNHKGVPVLLRQYLKLNGRIMGFNVDPNFNNSIDCLLWVDLTKADGRQLGRYMGYGPIRKFFDYHGVPTSSLPAHRS
ncbi:MAG: GNAT family N-acyltransferase [Pseudomonadota bacterium]